jgi:hypothetical protein
MSILEWWKKIVTEANSRGIPLPMIRSPDTGRASVSLTLVFLSFNIVIVGLIGRYSKMLEGIDVGQAIQLFSICAALYFGRKFQRDPKGNLTIDSDPNPSKDEK